MELYAWELESAVPIKVTPTCDVKTKQNVIMLNHSYREIEREDKRKKNGKASQ